MPTDSLRDFLDQQGARFGDVAGVTVAQDYGDTTAEYRALTGSVALVELSFRGCLAVRGHDRVKCSNGPVTHEVAGL
ncbi:MAG: aminomethyl transferase family protein, partial [Verrucomicrobiota bacterium]|nr:aminomethyl transferase family protein [Verrucomicrobiota bacterium]